MRVWEGDFYAAKGVALACLGSPTGPLHVYTTHICANYAHSYEPAPEPKAASGGGHAPSWGCKHVLCSHSCLESMSRAC